MKNKETVEDETHKLNRIIYKTTRRPNGTLRIQQDYSYCPTMAEQHSAHLSDINYLMDKYQPDELAAYIAARKSYRQEILGHDFAAEPDLTGAKNEVYRLKTAFDNLKPEIKNNFRNHVEFLKFIDNPANQEKMIAMGLMTRKEISQNTTEIKTPTTKEEKDTEKSTSAESQKKPGK